MSQTFNPILLHLYTKTCLLWSMLDISSSLYLTLAQKSRRMPMVAVCKLLFALACLAPTHGIIRHHVWGNTGELHPVDHPIAGEDLESDKFTLGAVQNNQEQKAKDKEDGPEVPPLDKSADYLSQPETKTVVDDHEVNLYSSRIIWVDPSFLRPELPKLEVTALFAPPQPQIFKAKMDERKYQHFTLQNGLPVLVISDPSTDKVRNVTNE